MSTPNLGIALLAESQSSKYVTMNNALDALDEAVAGFSSIAMSDANLTLSTTQAYGSFVLAFTGTLTANRNIVVPATAKLYVIVNATTGGFTLTVLTSHSGSNGSVAVLPGATRLVYSDGTNVAAVNSPANAQNFTGTATMGLVIFDQFVTLDATSAAFTLTLPDATKCSGTKISFVKKDSSGNLPTLQGASSQNIGASNTYTGLSAQYKSVTIASNGTQWYVTASN
jgi:hypothetical protein